MQAALTMENKLTPPALKLFLVEDSAQFREVLSEELNSPGEVEIVGYAESEEESIEALLSMPVDAAIVDLRLKNGSGLGILKYFRTHPLLPKPTLIVCTNNPFAELREHCLSLGADFFFDKSGDYEALRQTICELKLKKRRDAAPDVAGTV